MAKSRAHEFVQSALGSSDLLSGFVDKSIGEIEKLTKSEINEAIKILLRFKRPIDPEDVGAVAILLHMLVNEQITKGE